MAVVGKVLSVKEKNPCKCTQLFRVIENGGQCPSSSKHTGKCSHATLLV